MPLIPQRSVYYYVEDLARLSDGVFLCKDSRNDSKGIPARKIFTGIPIVFSSLHSLLSFVFKIKVQDFILFEDRLDNSLQRDLTKVEHVRMRLTHEPATAEVVDMELLEFRFIFDRSMSLPKVSSYVCFLIAR